MTDHRPALERIGDRVQMPEPALERLLERRDRKRRSERIVAAGVGVGVAIVAIVLGSTVIRTGGGTADAPPPTYDSTMSRTHVGHAVVVDLDGHVADDLLDLPDRATEVTVSPDGSKLAFVLGWGIYTMNADGSDLRHLRPNTSGPSWSPDGSGIVSFAAGQVYVTGADGTHLLRSLACGVAYGILMAHPTWSPMDDAIVCSGISGATDAARGTAQVVRYSLGSAPPAPEYWLGLGTRLAGGNGVNAWDAAWSPDGTRIAFSRGKTDAHFDIEEANGAYDIWLMNADGSNQRPLVTSRLTAEVGPFWSPDGTRVAFTSIGETRSVRIVDVATGATRMVTAGTVLGWLDDASLLVATDIARG
jgi:Tol biopolymer transport system component